MIFFHKEDVSLPKIKRRIVKNWIKNAIRSHKKIPGNINIIFCSDNYLLSLNQGYLKHNYYTDVITFDYVEGVVISGDVFISVERVLENSKMQSIAFIDEMHRVIIHGILHLIGFKDKSETEMKKMRSEENILLERLNEEIVA